AASNIVVGWSVNTPRMIAENEYYTASLEARLDAARQCAKAGYSLAFHFDPMFYYDGWEEEYASVVDAIFQAVPARSIRWISLGTLRMTPLQKKVIENRFPENRILSAELVTGVDGKLRYSGDVRQKMYGRMKEQILRRADPSTMLYLCMETAHMWRQL
ncbi:MAG: DNA photolyase, partial [Candidatus Omnitrophica bacterium]|nr:DNA photolyase [Candidatus Omnitrophota bacterium]